MERRFLALLPSKIEKSDRSKATTARDATQLFKRILEDLNPEDFTLEDVVGNYNAMVKVLSPDAVQINYGQSHLDYLLKKKYIKEARNGHYCVVRGRESMDHIGSEDDDESDRDKWR